MPKKRIIAFGLHETEIEAARQAMHGGEVTESFVLGEVDEAEIPALRARGLVIQEVEQPESPSLAGAARYAMFRAGARQRVRGGAGAPVPRATRVFRLVLRGPLLQPWREAILAQG